MAGQNTPHNRSPGRSGLVLGRYLPGPIIGHGATARVYRARDTRTNRDVALKEILLDHGQPRRARAEVKAASRLSHPNVVGLYDWGQDSTAMYLLCELVEGRSLAEIFASRRTPSTRRMVGLVAGVLDGLAHAHQRGVLHRDVKPANVLVGSDGRARIADFGIARLSDESRHTRTGVALGTMAYMAPEQATGRTVGAPADVYAACLVLYEGLTGTNPLATGNPAETARRAARAGVPDIGEIRPDLPTSLCRSVMSGLDCHPGQRPTAGHLAEQLRQHCPLSRPHRPPPASASPRQALAPLFLAAAAPLALMLGLGGLLALTVGLMGSRLRQVAIVLLGVGASVVFDLGLATPYPLIEAAVLAAGLAVASTLRAFRGRLRARALAAWMLAFGLIPATMLGAPILSLAAFGVATMGLVAIGVGSPRRTAVRPFGSLRVVR